MSEAIVNAINVLIKGIDLANRKGVFGLDEAGELFNAKMLIINEFNEQSLQTEASAEASGKGSSDAKDD